MTSSKQVEVRYATGEVEQFHGPVEILVSARGLTSITENNGEISYRQLETIQEIRDVEPVTQVVRGAGA